MLDAPFLVQPSGDSGRANATRVRRGESGRLRGVLGAARHRPERRHRGAADVAGSEESMTPPDLQAKAEQIVQRWKETWFHPAYLQQPDSKLVGLQNLTELIADAFTTALAKEREANCRAICEMCEVNLPLTQRADGTWWHDDPDGAGCEATAIRARSQDA